MSSESKVTGIYCMADDFCKEYQVRGFHSAARMPQSTHINPQGF